MVHSKTNLSFYVVLFLSVICLRCSKSEKPKVDEVRRPLIEGLALHSEGAQLNPSWIITGLRDVKRFKTEAQSLGVVVKGEAVFVISGPSKQLEQLRVNPSETPVRVNDLLIQVGLRAQLLSEWVLQLEPKVKPYGITVLDEIPIAPTEDAQRFLRAVITHFGAHYHSLFVSARRPTEIPSPDDLLPLQMLDAETISFVDPLSARVRAQGLETEPLQLIRALEASGSPVDLSKAVGIYSEFTRGERFVGAQVASPASAGNSDAGSSNEGMLALDIEKTPKELKLEVNGILWGHRIPQKEILRLVDLEFSNSAIGGVTRTWVSTKPLALALNLDSEKLRNNLKPGAARVEKIIFRDSETHEVIHTFWLKFVRPFRLGSRYQELLDSRNGQRLTRSFEFVEGTRALRLNLRLNPQDDSTYSVSILDRQGRVLDQETFSSRRSEIIFPLKQHGGCSIKILKMSDVKNADAPRVIRQDEASKPAFLADLVVEPIPLKELL